MQNTLCEVLLVAVLYNGLTTQCSHGGDAKLYSACEIPSKKLDQGSEVLLCWQVEEEQYKDYVYQHYLVLENAGKPLRDLVTAQPELLVEAWDAVCQLSSTGFVNGDYKPDHFFVADDGR